MVSPECTEPRYDDRLLRPSGHDGVSIWRWCPLGTVGTVVDMKNMDRWLGDGGMGIIAAIGGSIDAYGIIDGSDQRDAKGWCTGRWEPLALAANPHGIVQAGVHGIILDALMNFAINTACEGRDRTKATLEMKGDYLRTAKVGDVLTLRGDVVRITKQVAFAQASVLDAGGDIVSKATGTFLLHREPPAPAPTA